MADIVDDIKARLGVHDVVSQYVQLKKAGVNYKGLCPFHGEKTPSFVVSPEKQIFHCFGCHKGGDIFTFIQEIEGVEFAEALQVLADKAGIKLENIAKLNKGASKSEKDEYFKAHELACEQFEKQLHKSKEGKKVLEYLYKRGVNDETIKEFRIGFAPDDYEFLHPFLLKKGISKKVLLKSGFVSAKNLADDRVYDKFRSRLMFPIFDYMGRICGFGGRALKKDQMPKYLNSPENIIYNKSKILYGLSHSKEAVKEKGKMVLVEGYFDVILPYQEGVKNLVATSGTALTSDQVRLIKRFCSDVIMCFDNDKAGFEASKRAYSLAHAEGINARMVDDLEGKDPADFILEKSGEEFDGILNRANDFISVFIDRLLSENDIEIIEGRRKVLNELLPLYKRMSPTVQDLYVRELAQKMNIDSNILYDEIANFDLAETHPARVSSVADTNSQNPKMLISDIALALILQWPFLYGKTSDKFDDNDFDETGKSIYNALTDQYNLCRDGLKEWSFDKGVLADLRGKIDVLTLYADDQYFGFSDEGIEAELIKLIDKIKKDRRASSLREIQKKILEAEKSDQKDKLIELLTLQQDLLSD